MFGPLVSVLMTSFNREAFIAAAIESVRAQTLDDFELIVCDDASSDRTVEIARSYAERDARVKVIANATNVGDYPNRNRAAAFARGRYLKYHDSDDVMYPHCLAVMVGFLERDPGVVAALSGGQQWPGGPCPMVLSPRLAYEREFLGAGLFHVGPGAALFRRDAFNEFGGYPSGGAASDYLFWMDICSRASVMLVPADLFYYRVHAGQELSNGRNQMDYVLAGAAAWRQLRSPSCPLAPNMCEQAKRNLIFTTLRGAWRKARRGQFGAAAAAIRYGGPTAVEWLRYLRPPRRVPNAGTPTTSEAQA
jgi:glycosyl transferase family 2